MVQNQNNFLLLQRKQFEQIKGSKLNVLQLTCES